MIVNRVLDILVVIGALAGAIYFTTEGARMLKAADGPPAVIVVVPLVGLWCAFIWAAYLVGSKRITVRSLFENPSKRSG